MKLDSTVQPDLVGRCLKEENRSRLLVNRMSPHWHIVQSLLFSFLPILAGLISFIDLIGIIVLTLVVDMIDHGIVIRLGRSCLAKETASLIKNGEWLRAYQNYSAERLGAYTYMYLHNLPFVGFLTLLCIVIYATGFAMELILLILFGPILHLLSDFICSWTSENTVEHLKFWTLSPIKACYTRLSKR